MFSKKKRKKKRLHIQKKSKKIKEEKKRSYVQTKENKKKLIKNENHHVSNKEKKNPGKKSQQVSNKEKKRKEKIKSKHIGDLKVNLKLFLETHFMSFLLSVFSPFLRENFLVDQERKYLDPTIYFSSSLPN